MSHFDLAAEILKAARAADKSDTTTPKLVTAEVHKPELAPWEAAVEEGIFESLTDEIAEAMSQSL